MKRLLLLLIFSFFFARANAAVYFTPEQQRIHQELVKGQEQLLQREYSEALVTFKRLQLEHPESPAGYFGEMTVNEVQMLECEDFHLEPTFLVVAEAGKKSIDQVMQRYELNSWELMYAGSLLGLEGFFHARKSEWLSAYLQGTESRQIFQRVLKLDPNFVDAQFGIGMYLYWRSVFASQLKWVPFIPDQRAEGIAMVEKVAREGKVANELAKINLAMIDLQEKHYVKAEERMKLYLSRFPKNVIFRLMLGKSLLGQQKYAEATQIFTEALSLESQLPKAHYFLAMSDLLQQKPELLAPAETELDTFFASKPSKEWQAYGWYWRGRLYELRGEKTRAESAFKQAVFLEPELKQAKLHLRGLGGGLVE